MYIVHSRSLMPWSHLCVKPPRMSNVRQILEVPRNCKVLSRSATYYAALTRVSSLPAHRRHILKFLSTFTKASRRPRNYHVLPRRCRICHELATYHPKSLKLLYVAHTRQLYAKVWPRHNVIQARTHRFHQRCFTRALAYIHNVYTHSLQPQHGDCITVQKSMNQIRGCVMILEVCASRARSKWHYDFYSILPLNSFQTSKCTYMYHLLLFSVHVKYKKSVTDHNNNGYECKSTTLKEKETLKLKCCCVNQQ